MKADKAAGGEVDDLPPPGNVVVSVVVVVGFKNGEEEGSVEDK